MNTTNTFQRAAPSYCVAILSRNRESILVSKHSLRATLPRVHACFGQRIVAQIQSSVRHAFGRSVFVADITATELPFAICESLDHDRDVQGSSHGVWMPLEKLNEAEQAPLVDFLHRRNPAQESICRPGWIQEAVLWVESSTGKRLKSECAITQFNGGLGFAMLSFEMEDASRYWLKATGEPNRHEFRLTQWLTEHCSDFVPRVVSQHADWNAWLSEDFGESLDSFSKDKEVLSPYLETVAASLANLQARTHRPESDLLHAGAFDHSYGVLQKKGTELFARGMALMASQRSTQVSPLSAQRMRELRGSFFLICDRVEQLGIPVTLLHADINPGNILISSQACRFIDWSEVYLGFPLITLQHLLLFNKVERDSRLHRSIEAAYLRAWSHSLPVEALEKSLPYMRFLAAIAALLGRGIDDPSSILGSGREAQARSLFRELDRASQAPDLQEALCR